MPRHLIGRQSARGILGLRHDAASAENGSPGEESRGLRGFEAAI
jgi:hypothetical protein